MSKLIVLVAMFFSALACALEKSNQIDSQLRAIFECELKSYPKTPKQKIEFNALFEKMQQSVLKVEKQVQRPANDKISGTYTLKSPSPFFGFPIQKLGIYMTPSSMDEFEKNQPSDYMIVIKFNSESLDKVAKSVEEVLNVKLTYDTNVSEFEMKKRSKIFRETSKYPSERQVIVRRSTNNITEFICRFDSADPNVDAKKHEDGAE